ncbi:dachshund homolog 1-like isoform X2 [Anneissia japonica]|uniref:dachshund homolog 1-like isoform X2 n=1 Tax=Anneissia japonica TaxID=1529436 RepID=UPI001425549C|nr:dachshund homolog 1-like isoform X2 [Anneissia japonica]
MAVSAPPTQIPPSSVLYKLEKTAYSTPAPVSNDPANNECKLIEYRGAKVASFNINGLMMICLPQAFEVFLKHLVGGLHTVYTKLKRLEITPVVCNVEQVRILRGLGAIQPGVNRCKLLTREQFDILYQDCTTASSRPGRPPKRSMPFMLSPPLHALTHHGADIKKSKYESDFHNGALSPKIHGFSNGYGAMVSSPYLLTTHPAFIPASFSMASRASLMARGDEPMSLIKPPLSASGSETSGSREHSGTESAGVSPRDELSSDVAKDLSSPHSDDSALCKDRRSEHSEMIHREAMAAMEESLAHIHSKQENGLSSMGSTLQPPVAHNSYHSKMPTPRVPHPEPMERHERHPAHNLMDMTETLTSQAPSQIETLLTNIQGLLKVAADNAKQQEKQVHLERAEMKMELIRERELREASEKQLQNELRRIAIIQKRLKKEKRAKRRLQEELEIEQKRRISGDESIKHISTNEPLRAVNGDQDDIPHEHEMERSIRSVDMEHEMERSVRNEMDRKLQDVHRYFKCSLYHSQ